MIDCAVMLAAGCGSRLSRDIAVSHKALVRIGGEPLIARNCQVLADIGIDTIVVVTGFEADAVRTTIRQHLNGHPEVSFVHNPEWRRPNGLSALAGAQSVVGNYLLLMADHVFDPRMAASLCRAPLGCEEVLLAVDRKLEDIYDMEDATKVRTRGDRIVAIGKDLAEFDAVDTGLFACSPALVPAMREEIAAGRSSLSMGVQHLADRGRLRCLDIGDLWWQDVDTPGMLDHARRLLRQAEGIGEALGCGP